MTFDGAAGRFDNIIRVSHAAHYLDNLKSEKYREREKEREVRAHTRNVGCLIAA